MTTLAELRASSRKWKIALMDPREKAGSTVGTLRANNRSGGKIRGKKSGGKKQPAKVNVSKLVQKTKTRA